MNLTRGLLVQQTKVMVSFTQPNSPDIVNCYDSVDRDKIFTGNYIIEYGAITNNGV
jgi:hypothetical protein